MKKTLPDSRGFMIISGLLLFVLFIIFILVLISWSGNEFSWTSRSFMSLQALNLADAGAELAVWEIVHNDAVFGGFSGANPKTLSLPSFTDAAGKIIGDITISVDNTSPGHYLIVSSGFVPSIADQKAKKTVKVKVFPRALFNNAVFGYDSVIARGNAVVDSYNSDVTPYSPLMAGSNGDVGTNGSMSLIENSMIKGDLFIGPGGTVSGNTPAHTAGETYYSGVEAEIQTVTLPDYFNSLPSMGALILSGHDDVTLPPGNYVYDSMSLAAQSRLTISANTNIYVKASVNIAGQSTVFTNGSVQMYIGGDASFAGQGIVNSTGNPASLEIYGLGNGTNISFTGQNDFYGTFYAPYSTLYLAGDANFYGAVAGEDVTLAGNIKIHYDEALSEDGPFSGYDIAYWQED